MIFLIGCPYLTLVKAEYLDDEEIVENSSGYSPEATLVQTIKTAFRDFMLNYRHPNVLIFVNSLAEANEFINLLRYHSSAFIEGKEHLPQPIIDGTAPIMATYSVKG